MPRVVQTFNDGVVSVYKVSNIATEGAMPVEKLTLKRTLRYAERIVGLTRRNFALQDGVNVRYVLRCPLLRDISAQDVAIPTDGEQYRIWDIQYPEDISPPVMDITLEEIRAKYEVYQPEPDPEPDSGLPGDGDDGADVDDG